MKKKTKTLFFIMLLIFLCIIGWALWQIHSSTTKNYLLPVRHFPVAIHTKQYTCHHEKKDHGDTPASEQTAAPSKAAGFNSTIPAHS